MAVAAARVDDLERGDLPAVCAKTGEPCEILVRDTLRVLPRWVPPLVVLFVFPYFIARAYASRPIEVKLPVAPSRQERIRKLVRTSWFALALAVAGLSAAFFGAGSVAGLALVVGLLGYLLIVYAGDQMWVGARPSRRSDVVILTRVHPEFARALSEMYAVRAERDSRHALPSDY